MTRLGGRASRPGRAQLASRLSLVALLILPQVALPATITVDGAGSSTTPGDGECSLREAINNANTDSDTTGGDCDAGSGPDSIVLATDVTLTEVDIDDRGLPLVSSDITVEGAGFTVARDETAPEFAIFKVVADGALTLNHTTVSNGFTELRGGGVWNNGASLTMSHSTLSGNTAGYGGGMCTDYGGTATAADCAFTGNEAGFGGGVAILDYSAGYVPSTALLENVTISENTGSVAGGGLFLEYSATATLTGSTVSDNYAAFNGGGIVSVYGSDATVNDSTIAGNTVGYGSGGGLFTAFATATITNSTLTGNYATFGGGSYSVYDGTVVTLQNSTVVGNTETYGIGGGGVYSYYFATTYMANTIVGANSTGDCSVGGIVDLGNNFSSDGSCAGSSLITPDVDFDTTLADNGGPTETLALLDGSVAIDADAACALAADQRGYGRDGICDSGSFEFEGACELVLEGAGTAIVGVETELDIHCATPSAFVRVSGGRNTDGSVRNVPGCGAIAFDIGPSPNNFGSTVADAEGDAFSSQTLGENFAGETIYFQALDRASCTLTNVLAVAVE